MSERITPRLPDLVLPREIWVPVVAVVMVLLEETESPEDALTPDPDLPATPEIAERRVEEDHTLDQDPDLPLILQGHLQEEVVEEEAMKEDQEAEITTREEVAIDKTTGVDPESLMKRVSKLLSRTCHGVLAGNNLRMPSESMAPS